tara:strand:+ start:2482 stop:2742 length:261 start_codon:yes stop_codon:yes gene_type:complete
LIDAVEIFEFLKLQDILSKKILLSFFGFTDFRLTTNKLIALFLGLLNLRIIDQKSTRNKEYAQKEGKYSEKLLLLVKIRERIPIYL